MDGSHECEPSRPSKHTRRFAWGQGGTGVTVGMASIVGKSADAKERRFVPEVIEDFFAHAGPVIWSSPGCSSPVSTLIWTAGSKCAVSFLM